MALLVTPLVRADVVVPNAAAATEADGAFFLFATAAAGRTYQMTINASELTAVVGDQIEGFQLRLNNASTANWPPANASFATFDVFLGPGVTPSAMSTTFASNFTSSPTQVRSGSLTFNAGDFTFGASGTTPNAWGPAVLFNTPYLYTGGDLTVELRFSGMTGTTTTGSFDALTASGGPGNGWGVTIASRWTGNITGTTGANGNALVLNLVTSAIPEPATGSVAIAGLMAGLFLRGSRRTAV